MKNFNRIYLALVSLITIIAFFFVHDFTRAAYGWFRPSSDNVTFTLIGIFTVSLIFIFYGYHFRKMSITYLILSIILFVGYFGFLIIKPSANMFQFEGLPLSLSYAVGKYGSFVIGVIIFIRLLVSRRQNKLLK